MIRFTLVQANRCLIEHLYSNTKFDFTKLPFQVEAISAVVILDTHVLRTCLASTRINFSPHFKDFVGIEHQKYMSKQELKENTDKCKMPVDILYGYDSNQGIATRIIKNTDLEKDNEVDQLFDILNSDVKDLSNDLQKYPIEWDKVLELASDAVIDSSILEKTSRYVKLIVSSCVA